MAYAWDLKLIQLALQAGAYGVYNDPVIGDALLTTNATINPLEGEVISRQLDRPHFGGQPQKHVSVRQTVQFDVEAQGAGGTGQTPPPYSKMLRVGGLAETISAVKTIQASPATPIRRPTGRFTYVQATPHTCPVPRLVTLECTTLGGSGVAAFTVSAPAAFGQNAYSAAAQVMTDAAPFPLCNAGVITPTIATPFAVGDKFQIVLLPEHVAYTPISTGHEHGSLKFNIHGARHRIPGLRGGLSLVFPKSNWPKITFKGIGLDMPVDTEAAGTPDYGTFIAPDETSPENTPLFRIHELFPPLESFSVELGGPSYFTRVNQKVVRWVNREPMAKIQIEAPDLATKNMIADARADIFGPLAIFHGSGAGRIVGFIANNTQILKPTYAQTEKILDTSFDLSLLPTAGNDDFKLITC